MKLVLFPDFERVPSACSVVVAARNPLRTSGVWFPPYSQKAAFLLGFPHQRAILYVLQIKLLLPTCLFADCVWNQVHNESRDWPDNLSKASN